MTIELAEVKIHQVQSPVSGAYDLISDPFTKSKDEDGNFYGCFDFLTDGVMIAGKVAVIDGYGDVGKRCAAAMKQAGVRVIIAEFDPVCVLQATIEGFEVLPLEEVLSEVDIIGITTKNIITVDDMRKVKNDAIICNFGHFFEVIDMDGLESFPGVVKTTINPETDKWIFPDTGKGIFIVEEGRPMNLGRALQLEKLKAEVTRLTKDKADHICIQVKEGPEKPADNKYGARQQRLLDFMAVVRCLILILLFVKMVLELFEIINK